MTSEALRRLVDAHHHLWQLDRLAYPWLNGVHDMEAILGPYDAICSDFKPRDLVASAATSGLTKSVHIETADHPDPVAETALLQHWADNDPGGFPHAIVAAANLAAPDVEATLDRHGRHANFRGVRMLSLRDAGFLYDDALHYGLAALGERGLSFDVDVDWTTVPVFLELARAHPRVNFIVGHCGFPKYRSASYLRHWSDGLQRLAAAPNVVCKISGLGMRDHRWSLDSIRPWVQGCLAAFGVERCMFGSNWPVDSLFSDYPTLVCACRQLFAEFDPAAEDALFAANAERIYRI